VIAMLARLLGGVARGPRLRPFRFMSRDARAARRHTLGDERARELLIYR
jgi:hypothetical protein